MKQRGTFSITTLILLTVQQKPLTKTRLMQTLILSYKRVSYYCDLLMHKGLIEYDPANRTYVITPRGTEILRLYQELAGHLEPIAQMIKKKISGNLRHAGRHPEWPNRAKHDCTRSFCSQIFRPCRQS